MNNCDCFYKGALSLVAQPPQRPDMRLSAEQKLGVESEERAFSSYAQLA
jgi:hypothetical protein